jgi:hypothetical protein
LKWSCVFELLNPTCCSSFILIFLVNEFFFSIFRSEICTTLNVTVYLKLKTPRVAQKMALVKVKRNLHKSLATIEMKSSNPSKSNDTKPNLSFTLHSRRAHERKTKLLTPSGGIEFTYFEN